MTEITKITEFNYSLNWKNCFYLARKAGQTIMLNYPGTWRSGQDFSMADWDQDMFNRLLRDRFDNGWEIHEFPDFNSFLTGISGQAGRIISTDYREKIVIASDAVGLCLLKHDQTYFFQSLTFALRLHSHSVRMCEAETAGLAIEKALGLGLKVYSLDHETELRELLETNEKSRV